MRKQLILYFSILIIVFFYQFLMIESRYKFNNSFSNSKKIYDVIIPHNQSIIISLVNFSHNLPQQAIDLHDSSANVCGYFTKDSIDIKEQITLLTFGDMMLDRGVSTLAEKSKNFDYPFLNIDSFLKGVDFRIANLEGPITNFSSTSKEKHGMQFTISQNFLKPLKKRFEILSLANNHMLDFKKQGLDETKKFLTNEKIIFLVIF